MDLYRLSRVDYLFTAMSGEVSFTKLDLSHVYLQLQSSRQYVTINTHRVLYRYTRLPFGVSSAPGIFQLVMDNLLQRMTHVVAYFDDILISGRSEQEHLDNLEPVFKKLLEAGMRLKRKNVNSCCQKWIIWDIKSPKKVSNQWTKRSGQSPMHITPNNVFELRSFWSVLTLQKIFTKSSVLSPLYQLHHKSRRWQWGKTKI